MHHPIEVSPPSRPHPSAGARRLRRAYVGYDREVEFQPGTVNAKYLPERRKKPRIQGPISASVRGTGHDGGTFELEAILDNLSAGGLYLRMSRRVEEAAELSFAFRLPPGAGADDPGMRFAANGIVRRVEPCAGGTCGLGVEFTRYREL